MSKYIKDNMLSVGFNPLNGQRFFDLLISYEKYIKEFFFDISYGFNGNRLNEFKVIDILKSCNTYDIPANLLFNNHNSIINYDKKIDLVKTVTNLHSVTILNPEHAIVIKEKYPDIEIHLSTRFWDWGRFKSNMYTLIKVVNNGYIDVVNVSSPFSYNDYDLIHKIHELGMRVKYIANDGCIINKDKNYSCFPECNNMECRPNPFSDSACNLTCYNFTKKYPWIELCKAFLYKESLKFYNGDIDIIKISGRHRDIDYIVKYLNYWTSDNISDSIFMSYLHDINISGKYDLFLEYIKDKSKCKGNCWECKKCKKYWELFVDKSIRKDYKGDGTVQETAEQRARREHYQ